MVARNAPIPIPTPMPRTKKSVSHAMTFLNGARTW